MQPCRPARLNVSSRSWANVLGVLALPLVALLPGGCPADGVGDTIVESEVIDQSQDGSSVSNDASGVDDQDGGPTSSNGGDPIDSKSNDDSDDDADGGGPGDGGDPIGSDGVGDDDEDDGSGADDGGDPIDVPDDGDDETHPAVDPGVEPSTAFFEGVADSDGWGAYSAARSLSGHASVMVGAAFSETLGASRAFWWSEQSGLSELGTFSSYTDSLATAVSGGGTVVVGYVTRSDRSEAFRWTPLGGMVGLGDLSGGAFNSRATGASADGSVVVGIGAVSGGYRAFRWTSAGGMVSLGGLPGGEGQSWASGVSGDGSKVVGHGLASHGDEAFIWTTTDGMVGLGALSGGTYSRALAISDDGSTVVGVSESATGVVAFRHDAVDGMVSLGDLDGGDVNSTAHAVSADGSVIVGTASTDEGFEAFVWTAADGMRSVRAVLENELSLNLTGWTLTSAHAVSDSGRVIAGRGIAPDGASRAWVACLPNP